MHALTTGTPGLPHSLFNAMRRVHFVPDDGTGGDDGAAAKAMADKIDALIAQVGKIEMPPEVMASLRKRADDAGSAGDEGWKAYAMLLADQLKASRDKLREIADAPKGSMVITDKETVDALATAKSLLGDEGFKALPDRLKALTKLQGEDAERTKLSKLDAIAEATNMDAAALKQLPGIADLVDQIEKTEVGEGEAKVTSHLLKREGQAAVEFRKHIETAFPMFWPVIDKATATAGNNDAANSGTANGGTNASGIQHVGTALPPGVTLAHTPASTNQQGNGNGGDDLLASVLGPMNAANATKPPGNG